MLSTVKSLYFITYVLIIIVDTLLDTYFNNTKFYHNYIQHSSVKYGFIKQYLILFFSNFCLLTLFSLLFNTCLITIKFETYNLIDYITFISNNNENDTNLLNTGKTLFESTLNINYNYVTIIIKVFELNNIIAAAYISGGAVIGHNIGKRIVLAPILKIISALFILIGIEFLTNIMTTILNVISVGNISHSLNSNYINKYEFLLHTYTNTGINFMNDGFGDLLIKKYPQYPLSILFELNRLINIEIIFMFMLINIFIIKKLNQIDFKIYIPNNKLGKIIGYIINRYIKTWSSISKYMIYLAVGMIIYSIILSKLAIILISIS